MIPSSESEDAANSFSPRIRCYFQTIHKSIKCLMDGDFCGFKLYRNQLYVTTPTTLVVGFYNASELALRLASPLAKILIAAL